MKSELVENPGLAAALRSLLYMRMRELTTRGSQIRVALTFVAAFGLLWLSVDQGDSDRFWFLALAIFALKFLPVFCLTKGGETLRSELKDGTIEYLWTRSVGKPQLFVAFYASALLSVAAVVVPCLLALSIAGSVFGGMNSASQHLALWLCLGAATLSFTALACAMSAFSSKFVVLGILYFSFVELGLGNLPTGLRSLAVSAHLRDTLEPASEGNLPAAFSALGPSLLAIAIIGAVALAVGLAIFNGGRYVVGGEKEA